ncbi:hypothetical protein H5410_050224 [Solanum commersonii]|uniref:KIB1-4 beta-propeller domain-containing protein n=1 Tax=Solanum commersonii TaxID=4109 RepID=A0A9J5WWF3_SOLCO|nr:hypothetical protein H5410_050224 [Solanum commersonii]
MEMDSLVVANMLINGDTTNMKLKTLIRDIIQFNHGTSVNITHCFNDIIELPDLLETYENICPSWTFSCPPDSSSSACFVVDFDYLGNPPDVCIIKVGETNWTYHNLNDPVDRYKCFHLTGCNSPIFFKNNIVYLLGDKGNLEILTINEDSIPSWKFYGKSFPRRRQNSIQYSYNTAEDGDNKGMLVVFLSHHEGKVETWRYKMNGEVLKREKITSLDNN